jgi:hypothetical protein
MMNLWVQMKEMFVEGSPLRFTNLKVDWRETTAKLSWVLLRGIFNSLKSVVLDFFVLKDTFLNPRTDLANF